MALYNPFLSNESVNMPTTMAVLLETAFSVGPVQKWLQIRVQLKIGSMFSFTGILIASRGAGDPELYPCGGGVEYLHRDPASRRRRRKRRLISETVNYWDSDPRKTALARPAAYTKDRPAISSERAPHESMTVTVKE
jgi:hypothetical protein